MSGFVDLAIYSDESVKVKIIFIRSQAGTKQK